MNKLRAALILCITLISPFVWADYGKGVAHYEQGEFAEALREFERAAEQGDSNAQFAVGIMYDKGEAVPEDDSEAVRWYRQAAEQGHGFAQFSLGLMYAEGFGIKQDYKEAAYWYLKAAEQGDSDAQHSLAELYERGLGLSQDDQEALKWYRLSAEQGDPEGLIGLGAMFADGRVVRENKVLAYALFVLADNGDQIPSNDAKMKRLSVIQTMTPEEIEKGQVLSTDLSKPNHFHGMLATYFEPAK